MSYGATIASIYDKKLLREMVLGFDDDQNYTISDKYFGCTVGRVANRISNGRFVLNNQEYLLAVNNGPNHLHGGIIGFDKKIFECIAEDNSVECTFFSVAMEEGYPGNLEVKIFYTLIENQLHIQTRCLSDTDTLVNLTNHTYFNLNQKKESIANHRLTIMANRFYPVDEFGCTFNQPFQVKKTPFDFTKEKSIADCLNSDHPQILSARGLDHHFEVCGVGFRLAARLSVSDTALNIYTDKPGVHVYTGNYLDGKDTGFENTVYHKHSGICFEAQYVADSINFDSTIAPILRAGQIQEHKTVFEFEHTLTR